MTPPLTCVACGVTFPRGKRAANYCSPLCRQKAWRDKDKAPEDFCRTLNCVNCQKPFMQNHKSQKFCDRHCKRFADTKARSLRQQGADISRVYNDPQAGDLVQSGGSYRWVVRTGPGLRRGAPDEVTFRTLPSNDETTVTVLEWQTWCKLRNGNRITSVTHVLARKLRPLNVMSDAEVTSRQRAAA